ncbi:MAG: Mrp/NBP35 family ATP-binding protein [Clostridia bacterium]|nr:Mrp/NBP35 family ATP-binding protein [Clostridia bacterium]
MADCNHDCSSCASDCADRNSPQSLLEAVNSHSSVKKVIAVISGKGGVGKSSVTALLTNAVNKQGKNVAVLDADITGPSVPKAFGITERAEACDYGIIPAVSRDGIKIMSLNMLLPNETDPVVWRGPIIGGTVKQFWTDVYWGDIDYMFIDMPPGTGDVPLTVFQSIPVNGAVIVTSPQSLVSMIVEKSVNMARLMNIPVKGIVENMSYLTCPDCGKRINVFGESRIEDVAASYGIEAHASLPIDPSFAQKCDEGKVEDADPFPLDTIVKAIL